MDRGAWQATVHGEAKSWTRLSNFHFTSHKGVNRLSVLYKEIFEEENEYLHYCSGDTDLIPGSGRSLEKEVAAHFNILAWEFPWTEEPGGLESVGLQRVRHN